MKLTEKQRRFCEEYLKDFNATQAYKRAGYSAKVESTARVESSKLLTNPNIQSYINELKKVDSENTQVTREMIIKELSYIAFNRIDNFIDVEATTVINDKGSSYSYEKVTIKDFAMLTDEQKRAIESVKSTKDGIVVRFHSKLQALDMLAKHIGFYEADNKQKVEPPQIDVAKLSKDSLKELWEASLKGKE